jgi:hypothetical protein
MANWPTVAELAQIVDINPNALENWEVTLDGVMASAIAKVKADVGNWDDATDEPDEPLARAAMRMAELMSERPSGAVNPAALGRDPAYQAHLFGHRRVFGIS